MAYDGGGLVVTDVFNGLSQVGWMNLNKRQKVHGVYF